MAAVPWHDLPNFTVEDMKACGNALRTIGSGSRSMEELARRIVRYFHDRLVDKATRSKACALVRFFKTVPYTELPPDLRAICDRQCGGRPPTPSIKCLTLLATQGEKREWNSRQLSERHQTIPLVSSAVIEQSPMLSQMIAQMGLEPGHLIERDPAILLDLDQKMHNAFLVPEAAGSAYVPDQQTFVLPFGIRSVLGFGGLIAGELFVVILFTRFAVSRETADMFQSLALSVKAAALPVLANPIFDRR
jgi:hypothetical protein